MNHMRTRVAFAGSALAAAVCASFLFVAVDAKRSAATARLRAAQLRDARLDLAAAESRLGDSDIDDAISAARAANATAIRVGTMIRRVAKTLRPATRLSLQALDYGRSGVRSAATARRQARVSSATLDAIAAYQAAAVHHAEITNRALRAILRALRKTNEEFP